MDNKKCCLCGDTSIKLIKAFFIPKKHAQKNGAKSYYDYYCNDCYKEEKCTYCDNISFGSNPCQGCRDDVNDYDY